MSKQVKFYDKRSYKKVNIKNKYLLNDYLQYLREKKRSESTVYQYKTDIRQFYCWLYKYRKNEYILDINKENIFQVYFSLYSNAHTSNNRINRLMSALRHLLAFAVNNNDYKYTKNILVNLHKLSKKYKYKRIFMSDKQISVILQYLITKHLYQQALYLSLSYDSAARLSELLQVNKQRDLVKHDMTNSVIGEGGMRFPLIYFDRTRKIYGLWMKQRGKDNITSIWCRTWKHERQRISRYTIYCWMNNFDNILMKETGNKLHITPRVLRRSALYNYLIGKHYYLKSNTRNSICMFTYLSHCVRDQMAMRYLKLKNMNRLIQYLGISLY